MGDFARSFRRLEADQGHGAVWITLCASTLLAAWLAWANCARICLYEITSDARVELDGSLAPVESPFLGRIVTINLRVGQAIHRGDVLAEIDSMPQELALRSEQAHAQGLDPQIERIRQQVAAEERARVEERQGARLSSQEAESRVREAESAATLAEQDLTRIRKVFRDHAVSAHDLDKAEADAGRLRAAVGALEAASRRIPQELAAHDRERDVRIARLQGEIATLDAQREILKSETNQLGYEIERRRIRAPVDGRIGESANLRAGAVVSEGDRLGSIIPPGKLLIVAQYPAQAAFGRIRAGQPATLRLDGFPWAEFGTVSATVERVAQEVRDGKVRVELSLADTSAFRNTLEHGMPGTIEIAVEHVSPWRLIVRTAGQWLARPV